MSVKAVVFDIGNVLIEWQPERFYDAEIGRARRERLFAEVDPARGHSPAMAAPGESGVAGGNPHVA